MEGRRPRHGPPQNQTRSVTLKIRLQKFLAESGVASRRASEALIMEGRVAVNGQVIRELGTRVDASADRVQVDGRAVRPRRKIYVALHKPRGVLCTRIDPSSRQTVHDLLPREWGDLFSVGRLDADSEGLLFLTNDGEFCLRLTHPRYEVPKIYRVTVTGRCGPEVLDKLRKGVIDKDELLRIEKGRLLSSNNSRSTLELELREGKNREIRRMLETLRLEVEKLVRVQIGPIKLGELPAGRWRVLTATEVKTLLSKL